MKRFWRDVSIDSDRAVRLDDRPVRTPGRALLALPTDALAEGIAEEWRAVTETVDPRAMPLTGLANAAIDRVAADPATFAAGLAKYGESDLLYYRAENPRALVQRQEAAWDPLLSWARDRYDVHFATTAGIVHQSQPAQTVSRLHEAIGAQDFFALAALSPIVSITGSLVGALALIEGAADADNVWQASQIDEDWQAEHWGEDALATAARDTQRRAYDAAVDFLVRLGAISG